MCWTGLNTCADGMQVMVETDDSAIDALLAVRNAEEIELVIRERGLKRRGLKNALSRRRQEASAAGRAVDAALLDFLDEEVDRLLPSALDETGNVSSLEQLMEIAIEASSLLEVLGLLRKYGHLLPARPYTTVVDWVANERPDLLEGIKPVLVVLAIWRGSMTDRLQGRLTWAAMCRDAGDFRHALHHVERALAEAGPDVPGFERAGALVMHGTLLEIQGDNQEAAEVYTTALDLLPESAEGMRPGVRYVLAGCLRGLGMREDALTELGTALGEIRDWMPSAQVLAGRCMTLRGLVYEDLGDYDEAAADYRAASELFASAGERGREFTARTNLATNDLKRGRDAAGIAALRELARTVDRWGYPGMSAAAHNNLGGALLKNQPIAALAEYSKALGELGTEMSESAAIALFGIGDAIAAQSDRASDVAQAMYAMGLLTGYMAGKQFWAVQFYLSRAENTWDGDARIGSMIQQALAEARRQGDLSALVTISHAEADRLVRAGDNGAALDLFRSLMAEISERNFQGPDVTFLQVAYASLLRKSGGEAQDRFDILWNALRAVDERQARAVLDERRAEVVAQAADVYDELVDLLAGNTAQLRLPDDRTPVELAFDLHEAARSRTFTASLADTPLPRPPDVPEGLWADECRLLAQERDLQSHLRPSTGSLGHHRLDRLREVRAQLAEVWTRMRPLAPEYVRLREGNPLQLREVRPLLAQADPGRPVAVVSYYCTVRGTMCFLVKPDGNIRVYRAGVTSGQLEDVARRLRATFNGDPAEFPPTRPISREAPHKRSLGFFTELGAELLSFTADVEEGILLCVVPHGPLHLLPLHALPAGTVGPLAARNPTVYAPSLSALAYTMRRGSANPVARTAFVAGVSAAEDHHPEFFEHDDQLFSGRWRAEALQGTAASRGAVLTRIGGSEVVHLTCHGYFDEKDPMRSGLLLGDGVSRPPGNLARLSRAEQSAYVVSARDLAETSLGARLVTLRACSAGMQGRANRGDEFSGLVRSLLYAGACAVVAALWNVDQRSSRDLLEVMYRQLAQGEPTWKAMWSAQRALLERADQPYLTHPYHWAPLVLVGDWR
jgi:tetratricopeptide (TPR) repeat protein